jgi:hypothetical protein
MVKTIAEFGYPKIYRCNLSNESEMIESLLKQHFVDGVHAGVSQFFNGLNSIGQLGDIILQNKQLFDKINRSEEGSNQRSKEDSTIYCFEIFLQDLERVMLSDYHLNIFSYLSLGLIVCLH